MRDLVGARAERASRPEILFVAWPAHDIARLTEAFRRAVLRLFLRLHLFDEDQAAGMLTWPHSGFHVHAAVGVPASSSASTSSTDRGPSSARRDVVFGPMPGMSASFNSRMKASSPPGLTTCTPLASVPGFGLARSAASFDPSFVVPPPIDTVSDVSAMTASRIRCAIVSRDACSYSTSVRRRPRRAAWFGGGRYAFAGSISGSTVRGTSSAIARTQRAATHYFQRPDDALELDTARTSLAGLAMRLSADKVAGTVRGGLGYQHITPGYETNNLGFLSRADQQVVSSNFRLVPSRPHAGWRNGQVSLFSNH